MKWLARLIEGILYIVFAILYLVLLHFVPKDVSPWWSVPIAIGFATFFMVAMGWILSLFPYKIRKYWENKTADNPDGCSL